LPKLEDLKKEVAKKMEKNDLAHDFEHIMRVYKNAQKIGMKEKVNMKLVLPAVLLHDIVNYPKTDRRSKSSSLKSSLEAKKILKRYGYADKEIKIISDAIRDHSFSRGVTPNTIEGKILQDADRLDGIGAIGIARTFAVSGTEKRSFYDKSDPFCKNRQPDDKKWALDHFYRKLLLLEKKMNTKSAKVEAKRRSIIMKKFLSDFKKEI